MSLPSGLTTLQCAAKRLTSRAFVDPWLQAYVRLLADWPLDAAFDTAAARPAVTTL